MTSVLIDIVAIRRSNRGLAAAHSALFVRVNNNGTRRAASKRQAHLDLTTTSKPLCRSISRYFIRFLEKDSSRKLIFFPIFGRRFLEKDDFQQDPLLFETRPTPSCKKMTDGLAGDAQMRCISQTKTSTNSDSGL